MKTLITEPQAGLSGSEKKSSVITAQAVLRQNLPQDKTMKTKTSKSLLTLLLQLLIIHCALLIGTADATIRYVSPHGSNQPPYTSWETAANKIQDCIDVSEFGDTIYVANGVYEEIITLIAGLTVIGAGMDSCYIDTRSIPFFPGFYSIWMADSCYFSGFHVLTQSDLRGFGVYISEGPTERINSIITNNKLSYAVAAISFSGYTVTNSNTLVHKNIITHTKRGVTIALTKPTITENLIITHEDGLVSALLSRPTYLNNIIVTIEAPHRPIGYYNGQGYSGILKNNLFFGGGWYGMSTFSADTITNNVIYGTDRKWESGISGSPGYVINNHIEDSYIGFWLVGGYPAPQQYKYNNMWNNITNYQNYSPDTTNLSLDPMFVNPDSMDFKLQMYSPLIDAGDPDILDVDGSRSDIGLHGGPYGMSYQYIDLPPRPPQNVIAVLDSMDITIKWNPNTEADFSHYNLYRDTTAGFPADSTTIVMSLGDTFYNHIIPPGVNNYYYKLTAVDNQRNESLPSEEIAVNISSMNMNDYPTTINDYILYQNYPNPFNPSTKIAYRLKEGGYVKLYVYDIKGELVDILVNQHQEGGYYEVEFNASAGIRYQESPIGAGGIAGLASGIYIYQIMVRGENNIPVFTDMKKMLLIK